MGNSLRCCLACVLPCGALDLIRIVHLNGYVEEITRPITAGEILQANPNHVLSKPCSQGNMVRKILILSPHSELKRGSIYFLIPDSSLPSDSKHNKIQRHKLQQHLNHHHGDDDHGQSKYVDMVDLATLDHENVEEKSKSKSKTKSKSERHQRRRRSSRGKSGVWQPHLASITEDF